MVGVGGANKKNNPFSTFFQDLYHGLEIWKSGNSGNHF